MAKLYANSEWNILPQIRMSDIRKEVLARMPVALKIKVTNEEPRIYKMEKAYENFVLMKSVDGYKRCFKYPDLLKLIRKGAA